ncbi:MAG: S8 family peptidase, partial [Candidatus Hodarchaeales archaeon]
GVIDAVADKYQKVVDFDGVDLYSDNLTNITQWYDSEARIGSNYMYDLGYNGTGIKVCVIDTGIDKKHHDLQEIGNGSTKIISEASFIDFDFDGDPDDDTNDMVGHGTHVAGTVAGNGYHRGVAPDAYLINARALDDIGWTYTSWVVSAVEWAVLEAKADIITMSIGWDYRFFGVIPAVNDIVGWAWDQGVVVTVAAANSGPDPVTIGSPCMSPKIITVGATDAHDGLALFSSRGPQPFGYPDPDICAPGVDVFSCSPDNKYRIASGTSMATPHAAGAIALLLEAHPGASPDQIKTNLMKNAVDINEPRFSQGAGLINLTAAHENWDDGAAIVFPLFDSDDAFHLSSGEKYSGYLEFISGQNLGTPDFMVSGGNITSLTIDESGLVSSAGHQFVPFSVMATGDEGDYFWTTVQESITGIIMNITVILNPAENDAGSGTDAGDIFSSAMEVAFGNYTGVLFDDDYYKIKLNSSESYTFIVESIGYNLLTVILDLYNSSGELIQRVTSDSYSVKAIVIADGYTGDYYVRVYIYSFSSENIDPLQYRLKMIYGVDESVSSFGDVNITAYQMYGIDNNYDGLYENMAINVTIEAVNSQLIDVVIVVSMNKTPDFKKWIYAVVFAYDFRTTAGSQNVTMLINGTQIADQQFAGEHVIYRAIVYDKKNFFPIFDEYTAFISEVFNSSDFVPIHLQYTGINGFQNIDKNEDGIADFLELSVTVDVVGTMSVSSFPGFNGAISYPSGEIQITDNSYSLDITQSGEQTILLLIDGQYMRNHDDEIINLELVSLISYNDPVTDLTTDIRLPYFLLAGDSFNVNTTPFKGNKDVAVSSIVDFGEDTDGDGNFDFLVFNVTFEIVKTGHYSLEGLPVLWSIGSQKMIVSDDINMNIVYLDQVNLCTGTHSVEIRFSGELISSYNANGPYMLLQVQLYDDYSLIDQKLNVVTENQYSSSDFDTPGVICNGITGIHYVDNDGTAEAESVELFFELNVIKTGTYYLEIGMQNYPVNYYSEKSISVSENLILEFNTLGIQSFNLSFDGERIWTLKYSGLMEISRFRVTSDDYLVLNWLNLDLFTVDWRKLEGAAPIKFTHEFDDMPTDSIPYQGIIIETGINVRIPSYYQIKLFLNVTSGIKHSIESSGYYETGNHTLEFILSAREFVVYFDDGPLEIVGYGIWSYRQLFYETGLLYTTSDYNRTDFDYSQPIILTGNYGHYVVDDNSNGKYEEVAITIEVEITDSSLFLFELAITDENETFQQVFKAELALNPGTKQLLINISGYEWIYGQDNLYHYDGALYIKTITIIDEYSDLVVEFDSYIYSTPVFSYSDFEYNFAGWFTGDIYHEFIDDDFNGLIDRINFTLTVEINRTGLFELRYHLIASEKDIGWNYYSIIGDYYYEFNASTTGELNVTVGITAREFLSTGLPGPYTFTEAELFYEDGYIQDDKQFNYLTEDIALDDFDRPAKIIAVSDRGNDNDGNGLFNVLEFSIQLEVKDPGTYSVDIVVSAQTGEVFSYIGIFNEVRSLYSSGNVSIIIIVPSSYITSRIDSDASFNAVVSLYSEYDLLDKMEYSTEIYDFEDWEEPYLPLDSTILEVLYYYSDTDNDGLFEFLIVDINILFYTEGSFTVTLDIYSYLETLGSYSQEIITYDTAILDVSFTIPVEDIKEAVSNERNLQLQINLYDTSTMNVISQYIKSTSNLVASEWDENSNEESSTTTTTTPIETTTQSSTSVNGFELFSLLTTSIVAIIIYLRRHRLSY